MGMEEVLKTYNQMAQGQKVTVFLLSSNREKYIGLAIEGVLRQTYAEFQLVILDNFSCDHTKDIVESFHDDRIHFIQRKSPNESPNYKFAFEICATEYLVVLHDDDIVEDIYLETVLKKIESDDFASVSVGAIIINENGETTGEYIKSNEDVIYKNNEYFLRFFSYKPVPIIFPTAIYKKSFYGNLDDFFKYEAGPARDQAIWFQTGRFGGAICILERALIKYRIHSNQDSFINCGFMELQLIDALLDDGYYHEIITKFCKKYISFFVWKRYCSISKRYYLGLLDKDKFDSFFNYKCVGFIKNTFFGKLRYMIMSIIHHFPLSGLLIKLLLKIKNNYKRR